MESRCAVEEWGEIEFKDEPTCSLTPYLLSAKLVFGLLINYIIVVVLLLLLIVEVTLGLYALGCGGDAACGGNAARQTR